MLSTNMRTIYRKWFVLGLLSMCLLVFGYSDAMENVRATAPCKQDCETSQFMCNDSCSTSCTEDNTDAECSSCILSCRTAFINCNRVAVDCGGSVANPGRCSVNYADHCPIDGGQVNCSASSAHAGYSLICNNSIGSGQCVSCPNHEYCQGANGLPPCF